MDINPLQDSFQRAMNLSRSPGAVSTSPTQSFMNTLPRRLSVSKQQKALKPFSTGDMRILLLENVNQTAVDIFKDQGYQVEFYKSSLPEEELIEKIKDVHAIGIRSKTKLTANILKHAKNLVVIGCFCIGTNQVDLDYAASIGVAVFNSPFSNSRSVAELVIAEIISLLDNWVTDPSNYTPEHGIRFLRNVGKSEARHLVLLVMVILVPSYLFWPNLWVCMYYTTILSPLWL